MGKMKELFMAMREAKWEGTPHEFLLHWLKKEAKKIDKKNEDNVNNNTSDDLTHNKDKQKTKSK